MLYLIYILAKKKPFLPQNVSTFLFILVGYCAISHHFQYLTNHSFALPYSCFHIRRSLWQFSINCMASSQLVKYWNTTKDLLHERTSDKKKIFFAIHLFLHTFIDMLRDYNPAIKIVCSTREEGIFYYCLIYRELWRKIYQGNDIDYIEIKTEGSMTVESDRRKYDYR